MTPEAEQLLREAIRMALDALLSEMKRLEVRVDVSWRRTTPYRPARIEVDVFLPVGLRQVANKGDEG